MTDTIASADGTEIEDLPSPDDLPEIKLIGHSPLFYWWPVWLASLGIGLYGLYFGDRVVMEQDGAGRLVAETFVADNTAGLVFAALLIAVIVLNNVRMRGLASIVAVLSIALVAVSLAYFKLWDDIVALTPELSVRINTGFYLLFGGVLFVVWAAQFLIFDRLIFYRIRPGQMIEERVLGGGERSFDSQGMLFEQRDRDLFRHIILGLGAGDLELVTGDARKATIVVPNVLFAERRVRQIQRLINVKPDHVLS